MPEGSACSWSRRLALAKRRRVPPAKGLRATARRRTSATWKELKGNRRGQHSIRINDQYRLCFTWTDQGPVEVEILDYH
jgi:proteic killer suppression protein